MLNGQKMDEIYYKKYLIERSENVKSEFDEMNLKIDDLGLSTNIVGRSFNTANNNFNAILNRFYNLQKLIEKL